VNWENTIVIVRNKTMRILIVDDEFLLVRALQLFFTEAGHDVVGTAGTLARAFALIDATQIDVAVLDVNLNGVSAEPVFKRLSDLRIPTVLISGYSQSQRPGWVTAPFLVKPFEAEELLKAIEALG
jgi:DNA-binding response OmpR family regulator